MHGLKPYYQEIQDYYIWIIDKCLRQTIAPYPAKFDKLEVVYDKTEDRFIIEYWMSYSRELPGSKYWHPVNGYLNSIMLDLLATFEIGEYQIKEQYRSVSGLWMGCPSEKLGMLPCVKFEMIEILP